jgi:hypothetical protein
VTRHLAVIEKDSVKIGQERLPVGDAYREEFLSEQPPSKLGGFVSRTSSTDRLHPRYVAL